MNKATLLKSIKENGSYTSISDAEHALNSVTKSIIDACVLGEGVRVPGFVNFATTTQKGKSGTIPGTDKTYTTQDKRVVKAKAAKAFADAIAGTI